MKTNKRWTFGQGRKAVVVAIGLSAALTLLTASAKDGGQKIIVMPDAGSGGDDDKASSNQQRVAAFAVGSSEGDGTSGSSSGDGQVIIREIEPGHGQHAGKASTWLGVSVDEVSEALAAQLGLKAGQGLVVSYVSKDSPAAKAELQKNDVLVEIDGQMLVDSVQLRKLVQMHPEGDSVKVTFFRGGKKQSVSAKLVKKKLDDMSINVTPFSNGNSSWSWGNSFGDAMHSNARDFQLQLKELTDKDHLKEQMDALEKSLEGLGLDKEKMREEVNRTMAQTRKAIQEAIQNSRESLESRKALASLNKELAALAGTGVDVGKDSTIVIKNDTSSAKTMVKTDDTGAYVIVANPDKHLTVHDKSGKMLFDGAIQTSQDQEKVPKDIWEKVKPMLEQMEKGRIEIDESAVPPVPPAPAAPPAPPTPAEK